MNKKHLFIFMLVQTIFLSSTLAYADDINTNTSSAGSSVSVESIVTEQENAETEANTEPEENTEADENQAAVVQEEVVVEKAVVKTAPSAEELNDIKNRKAIFSFVKSKNPGLSTAAAEKVVDAALYASKKNNVDINMILAVMLKESTFTANARNASCYGIMQVSKNTGAGFGYSVKDLLDPYRNADVASRLLKGQTQKYGSTIMGLTAYNAGSGNVNKGNYNTNYANSVIAKSNTIKAYINSYMSKY